ncbi:ATP-dependent endonuclease [Amycolatopsis thermoflava]|uniref:ATP-dependent nuclease n=1 Tax=Amycolatopsis thermoflava TaxID=84480 RepID=UPI00364F57C9
MDLAIGKNAVIVGANDVGKTSILRLLHLTLGASLGQIYQQLTIGDLDHAGDDLFVEVTFTEFTPEEQTLFYEAINVAPEDGAQVLRIQLSASVVDDDPEALAIRRFFPDAGHDRGPTRAQQQAFGWRYLPATRNASGSALDGANSALRTLLDSLDLGDDQDKLAQVLEAFNTTLGTNGTVVSLRKSVSAHLSKAMPRSVKEQDLAVRTASDPSDDLLGNVTLFFQQDGRHVPLTEQSDGIRQLMSMTLFDLAEGSANVIAVDEPELHLHPASQRTIAELFRTANNQKILVTHSPYIVQRFEPSEVIAVDRDGRAHQMPDTQLKRIEKVRASWWSSQLLEALTARHVIVVEGLSDRIIVEKVAELMGISLDRLGAVAFDIGGADKFPHVYKLLGKDGFCAHILGLVDKDAEAVWLGTFGGKPKHLLGSRLWVSDPDLEAEYCTALTGVGVAKMLIEVGYCREQALLSSCSVADLNSITNTAMAEYCRKHKVDVAQTIAMNLRPADAEKIVSVDNLLAKLGQLGGAR